MGAEIVNNEVIQADREYKGRVSKLEILLSSKRGQEQYNEMILAISSRASAVSAAAMIGISPNTLTRWITKGKANKDSLYGKLWGDVLVALGIAVSSAEIEIHHQRPQFYLQRGFARTLVGDIYNTELNDVPVVNYNMDGTISHADDSTLALRDNTVEPVLNEQTGTSEQNNISEQMTIEALKILRANGIDLNALVDDRLKLETGSSNAH